MTLTRPDPLTVLCTVAAIAAAGCGGGDNGKVSVPADAVAVVCDDHTPIPRKEFDDLMAQVEKAYEAQKQEFPKVGTAQYNDLKNRAVEYLVQRYRYLA